jgi:PAS domain S-box-containing protein
MQQPGTQIYDAKVKCADGQRRNFLFNKATFEDAGGNVAGIVGVMLDITKRIHAETALRESEQRYRTLFEGAVLGIFQSTADGKIFTVNPAFAAMFGYDSPDELIRSVGDSAGTLYADPSDRLQNILKVLASEASITAETRYRRKDGSIFIGNFHEWQVKDKNDHFQYLEGFIEDITDRKRTEESLRESEERLRFLSSKLLEAQENESRRISFEIHDDFIQNLAVLKLQVRSIAGRLRKDQRKIVDECRKTLRFIDQLIESARNLSRDLSPAIIRDLNLCGSIQWILHDYGEKTKSRTAIDMENVDDLFDREDQVIIYRIFQEALRNIRKHAKADHVFISVKRNKNRVVFRICDNGVGFDIDKNLNRYDDDRGLGLAAMDERARMLGGRLEINSQKRQGTQIALTIPVSVGKEVR